MTFSERLKNNTSQLHQQVDQNVLPLLKNDADTLKTIFKQWYDKLHTKYHIDQLSSDLHVDIDLESLMKTLNPNEGKVPEKKTDSIHYESLGCYYVIRGSANGAQYLIRQIEPSHPLHAYFSYLSQLKPDSWQHFKRYLDQVPETHQESVIKGAKESFECLLQQMYLHLKSL